MARLRVHGLSLFRSALLLHANFVVRLFSFFWAAVLRVCVGRGISARLSGRFSFSMSFLSISVVLSDMF